MPLTPANWNIVLLGAWNTVILSPDGVRKRLFELPADAPIELEVAVDRPGPFRIGHDGLVVIPTSGKLEIGCREGEETSLLRAAEIGSRALKSLPETPVAAAGVNVRYRISEIPDSLLDLTRARLDDTLSDASFPLERSMSRRTVTIAPGHLNLEIEHEPSGTGTLAFNFHLASTQPADLILWLGRTAEFVGRATNLSRDLAGVENA